MGVYEDLIWSEWNNLPKICDLTCSLSLDRFSSTFHRNSRASTGRRDPILKTLQRAKVLFLETASGTAIS